MEDCQDSKTHSLLPSERCGIGVHFTIRAHAISSCAICISRAPGSHLPRVREREEDDMRFAMLSFLAIVISAFLGCQIGCGKDEEDVSFVEQGLSD